MRKSKDENSYQIAMAEVDLTRERPRRISTDGNGETTAPNTSVNANEMSPTGTTQEPSSSKSQGPQRPKEPSIEDIYSDFWSLLSTENPLSKEQELSGLVSRILQKAMSSYSVSDKYNWLIVHDQLTMMLIDTDKIYKAINQFKQKRELALIITSGGGQIEPAYLISKLCRESTNGKFVVVVPRRAKSAATLLCCGADEIHMGQMSELGPIDPQLEGLSALCLKNAVEHVAELASRYPKAADMFGNYLKASLNLIHLGHYERLAESAVQYADRLLSKRVMALKGKPQDVATQLVYGYKDHSFVIDKTEAESIFGGVMVQSGKEEYELGNAVYGWLSMITSACESVGYGFYMYGQPVSKCNFYRKVK